MQQHTSISSRVLSLNSHRNPSPASKLFSVAILLAGAASSILASAKWHIAVFAWISPLCYLYFFRLGKVNRKLLWAVPVFIIASMISSVDVAPFPLPALVALGIIDSIKMMIIFFPDRWITKKSNHFFSTLFFPAAYVSLEFLNTKFGGGVWWTVANSQITFGWLIQIASVAGLWAISFLVYWFASVSVWALTRFSTGEAYRHGLMIYTTVLISVLAFGAYRYNSNYIEKRQHIKVAGLSVPVMNFLEKVYKDYCGKDVTVDPKTSIASSKLQQVAQAEVPFIETADSIKFKDGFGALQNANDSLFILSQRAADEGAKIIVWSEANAVVFKFDEEKLIERGKKFASDNKVYLLMAVASLHSGKIAPGKKFLENQAVFIGPGGQILNVFHKNNPVPVAEASEPGNGIIPVVETPYGRISTSICYDADFPSQMRQLGKNKTDLLLLPSGDWYAISPYHTYMAIFRGIENGNSILRQASGGLSVVSDYRGRIQSSFDYFKPGVKFWTAEIPVGHVQTIYNTIGDIFAYCCITLTVFYLLYMLAVSVAVRIEKKPLKNFSLGN